MKELGSIEVRCVEQADSHYCGMRAEEWKIYIENQLVLNVGLNALFRDTVDGASHGGPLTVTTNSMSNAAYKLDQFYTEQIEDLLFGRTAAPRVDVPEVKTYARAFHFTARLIEGTYKEVFTEEFACEELSLEEKDAMQFVTTVIALEIGKKRGLIGYIRDVNCLRLVQGIAPLIASQIVEMYELELPAGRYTAS